MNLKSIFKEKPKKWGLRGDPFLWDDLERYFSNTTYPKNEAEFEKTFLSAFQELTGESLLLKKDIFIEKYNHGGMSSGMVSSVFWLHIGFPLLRKRYFHILGKQYPKDNFHDKSGFLAKARMHQSKYRANILQVPYDRYGNYLTKEDALKGLNFYNDFGVFSEVKKRYNRYSKPLYANMLRSEHIAFNMFAPFKQNLLFASQVLNQFLDNNILSIDKIEIEYAPSPAEEYLDDRTSFDVYMEYTHVDSSKSILGIEIKYTERDYKLKSDSRESRYVHRKESRYYLITKECNLYKDNWINILPTDRYRQVWRNQLLGESMLLRESDKYKHFTSITVYPEGNQHFIEVSKEYISMLKQPERFVGITYENLFSSCEKYCPDDSFAKWIEYMRERYIIND